MKSIKITKHFGCYQVNQIYTFTNDQADKIIANGFAVELQNESKPEETPVRPVTKNSKVTK